MPAPPVPRSGAPATRGALPPGGVTGPTTAGRRKARQGCPDARPKPATAEVVSLLRLLLGRAGTGKTETCLREALAALADGGPDGPPLVLLTPEQATFQLERALLDRLPAGTALVRLQVLSFRRLARAVLAETGEAAVPRLTAAGRRMLLRAVLRAERGRLAAFAASADRPGFAQALADQLAELQAYAASPDELERLAGLVPADPAARLRDLALLWRAYRSRLGDRARDPGGDLAAAAERVGASSLAGASCWVDGFAGFTAQEEALLHAWMRAGARLHVALCLDSRQRLPGPGDPEDEEELDPFGPTRRTLRRLLTLARRAGLPAPEVTRLDRGVPWRFRGRAALATLEARLWWPAPDSPPGPGPGADGHACDAGAATPPGVAILRAADPHQEAEACAAEIDRLCRLEGYRYREVAVVLRDLDAYRDLLSPACARRGVPLFADARRPANLHPAVTALLAALEVVTSGWSTAAVRRYLQGDLCGLRRDQADALDRLAVARAPRGAAWYGEEVLRLPAADGGDGTDAAAEGAVARRLREEARLHRLRLRMAGPLLRLQRRLGTAVPARQAARACYRLLLELGAPEAVARWMAEAEAVGQLDRAAWHRQCWEALVAVLDELGLALGDEPLPPEELAASLQSALEDLTVGLVPPGLDQVLCGGVERSRHPEVRAVFVLGVGEGLFPPAAREGALLGDADRRALRAAGLELGPTAEQRLLGERYLAYIAFTRAGQRLYLSYPAGAGPAEALRRVREILPDTPAWGERDGPTARGGVPALAGEVVRRLREGAADADWQAAAAWLGADPARRAAAAPVLSALDPTARPALPPALAVRLYPPASPSRLETMALCPFRHFAAYGLRLREREEAAVAPSHLGLLLHAALAGLARTLLAEGRDWAALDEAEAAARAEAALAGAAPQLLARLPEGSARGVHLLRAARRDLLHAVRVILAHARAGRYRTAGVEVPLLGPVQGRIDRLDRAEAADGTTHVRVVDYKTGLARFRLAAFADGVDLAPALYLADAVRAWAARPGGLFVLRVRHELARVGGPEDPVRTAWPMQGLAPAEREAQALHESALDGSVTGVLRHRDGLPRSDAPAATQAQFALLLRAAERRAATLAAAASTGRVAPEPYRDGPWCACDDCPYPAVCRFDPRNGHRYRWAGRGDPWARLKAEEVEGAPTGADAVQGAGSGRAAGGTARQATAAAVPPP